MKKTKKEFTPYNDYVDCPFDLKWPTAFPLGELQAAIKETDEFNAREIDVALIGDQQIDFYDIRHIQIHDFYKWSENEPEKPIDNPFSEVKFSELTEEENNAIDAFINEYYSDGDFYEDI